MANAQKYTRAACGHLAAHYERRKDEKGEYVKFGNQDIDPQKTHLNYNLAPRRGVEQIDFIRQRTTEARTLKRDDVNVMCSWVVTLPEYRHHNQNLHVSPDKKRGGEKVSAKEVITKNDLKTFHTDLERHLDSFRDWHFEVVNEATKDGNKEIAELKKQTAHEEVLKAQQEAIQARQRALQEQESIKPLVEQKNALRGEIEALQTEKEVLTAAEVEAIKGEKTLLGGLKGVTHKEFEAVKRTAAAVESMTAERDQALARAERADLRATAAEAKVKTAYEDANRQLQAKIREVEQDRPSMKAQMEIVQLRKENQTLKPWFAVWVRLSVRSCQRSMLLSRSQSVIGSSHRRSRSLNQGIWNAKESGFWGILAETTGRETQVSCSVGVDGIAQKIQKSRA